MAIKKPLAFLIPDHLDDPFISLSEAKRTFSLSQGFQITLMMIEYGSILTHCAKFFHWPFNMEIPYP